VACPSSFDSTFSSLLLSSSSSSWALAYYVVAIATSLETPLPLSLCRRLYCHAAATIAAPTPVLLRLSCASSGLLHRHLSCYASASLVVPHLRRLVIASPTILTCRCLSCRAGWLPSCCLSLCTVVSLFTTSLIAPPSLWVIEPLNPSKKRIVCSWGLPLSIRCSGTGRKASCGALEGIFRQRLAVGSRQHTSTFGIVHIFYRIKMFLVYII